MQPCSTRGREGMNPSSSALSQTAMAAPGTGSTAQQPPAIDINTLATLVQQMQQQRTTTTALGDGGAPTPGLEQNSKKTGSGALPDKSAALQQPGQDGNGNAGDPHSLMEQIAQLSKDLETEKAKSKTLQEEKKREMKGFLTGIRDYVNGLEGVKDPNAKQSFMQGIENMANHGIPNGIYDIMVSASAQNLENMKTIETLTKGYATLKDKYEGPGQQFAQEGSRFVDPTIKIVDSGTKRKQPELSTQGKVPLGMWDAFGDDIAKFGYLSQTDLLNNS